MFLVLAALALPGSLRAQGNFVYTNDNINGSNTVSGFSVATNGVLTLLSHSPFSTGGTGANEPVWYSSNRIIVSPVGDFLFASNDLSGNVSVFSINRRTGALTLVTGSPFAIDSSGCSAVTLSCGIGLAATPDGMFLMAANTVTNYITVFRIARSGALTTITGSPFLALSMPDGMKVTPDGKFLAVGEPDVNQIEMFRIAEDGALTSLGAFPGRGSEDLAGVDINCDGRLLYGAEFSTDDTIVDGYSISYKGTLTPLHGSPFEPGVGVNSNVVLLGYSLGRKTLFVSNQGIFPTLVGTITVFSVAYDGSLSLLAGSPFSMHAGANQPSGMATSQDGSLLYVANLSNKVSVFSVGKGGVPTEVTGSPFATGQSGVPSWLAAYPPRQLSLLEALLDGCPVNAHSGLSSPEE
jgi:6-phosphogluconolactonase (cycloisomerase 2 family)